MKIANFFFICFFFFSIFQSNLLNALDNDFLNYKIIVKDNAVCYNNGVNLETLDAKILKKIDTIELSILFFVLNEKESKTYIICDYDKEKKKQLKMILPIDFQNMKIQKTLLKDKSLYLLADESSENNYTVRNLYKIELGSGRVFLKREIYDFIFLENGTLALLEKRDGSWIINNNGVKIYLSLSDSNSSIGELFDNRIMVVFGEKTTEFLDLKINKSVYFYSKYESKKTELIKLVDKNNMIISCIDIGVDRVDLGLEYYKIFINGKEIGRTETALPPVKKSFTLTLGSGQYYLIQLQRMILDKKEGVYKKANNVYQPKPMQIFLPNGYLFFLNYKYDGIDYNSEAKLFKK